MVALFWLFVLIIGHKMVNGLALQNEVQGRDGYAAYGSYGGYGGGYGNSYPVSAGDDGLGILSDVLIGALAALAGLALLSTLVNTLGAAFAFFVGRKKRDLDDYSPEVHKQMQQMEILQQFIRSIPNIEVQPQKMMANYLSCTGLVSGQNHCLERLSCEFQKPTGNFSLIEKGAMSVILDTVSSNKYVPIGLQERLQKAVIHGKQNGDCKKYICTDFIKGVITS